MSELNYVPSWLDSAMTLLEKLNKCIEKIETIVNTVVSVTKTADDALSLANTNEADITTLETKTATLETKTATLETNVDAAKQEARSAYSLAQAANNAANAAQAIANDTLDKVNSKSPKLYLHEITLNTGYHQFNFFSITEESKKYSDKIKDGEAFTATLKPFNCVLKNANGREVSKCLTLQLSDISLNHRKENEVWNPQNCNGTILFAAYLDDNNQIATITDRPEWFRAAFEHEFVTIL